MAFFVVNVAGLPRPEGFMPTVMFLVVFSKEEELLFKMLRKVEEGRGEKREEAEQDLAKPELATKESCCC